MSAQAQISAAKAADNMINAGVVFRLVVFAVALALVPLSTFFGSKSYVFNGNSTYAAIAAVAAANLVLVIYIAQSVREDGAEEALRGSGPSTIPEPLQQESKKRQ